MTNKRTSLFGASFSLSTTALCLGLLVGGCNSTSNASTQADAASGQAPDTSDTISGSDSSDGPDSGVAGADATDGTDSADGTDTTDATDTADSTDAADATDAVDATDSEDGTDATDGTEGTDATVDGVDTTDTTDGQDGVDSSVDVLCGGVIGAACDSGFYCHYTVEQTCGSDDSKGTCLALPDGDCPLGGAPMCGCDGQTYLSECEAAKAGTSIAQLGMCPSASGGSCGGSSAATCADGLFCNYTVEQSCGASDIEGACLAMPKVCFIGSSPVCGCDNVTYDSECEANKVGVAIATQGKCGGAQLVCGGLLGFVCDKGDYCDWAPEDKCGSTDATGTCLKMPALCAAPVEPVCGCDGQTYSSACDAHAAGASVAQMGSCDALGAPCGGLLGFGCEKGFFCDYAPADKCGVTDEVGKCALKPEGALHS